MKSIFFFCVLLFCIAVSVNANKKSDDSGEDVKITICHVPPGNPDKPIQITISTSAWKVANALGSAGENVQECYDQNTGGDDEPRKRAHCPGGHGGDHLPVNGKCLSLSENRKDTYKACKVANQAATDQGVTSEAQARSSCDDGGKKIHICHVPPGNVDKSLDLDISCSGWKTCKASSPGFHCPGGHGGDFVGTSCFGVPVDTIIYDEFCKPKRKICFVPEGTGYPQTKIIPNSAWVPSGPCDDEDEYGPDCHGGDRDGECPNFEECPSGSEIQSWSGAPFLSSPICVCPSTSFGTCNQDGGGKWTCDCKTCSRQITCNGFGDCDSNGKCVCDAGAVAEDGTCRELPPPSPPACDANLFSGAYSKFQVVVLGNAALSNGDVEGSLFVKDSFRAKNWAVGKGSDSAACNCPTDPTDETDALYVGGTLSGNVDVCSGKYAYGSVVGLGANANCGLRLASTGITYSDVGTFALNARVISSRLTRYTPSSNYDGERSTITVVATSSAHEVWNINSCTLSGAKRIEVSGSVAAGATFVFNVKGSCDVEINELGFDDTITQNAGFNLWNFNNVKKVRIDDTELPGTVLAPVSTLTLKTGGSINGQVIALELRGAGQFKLRDTAFAGCIKLAALVDNDGACINGCPLGATQDSTTCGCTCGTACPGSQIQDSSSCQCYCPIADCGYGRQPNSLCNGCSKCSRSLPKGAFWLERGDCSEDNIVAAPSCSNTKNIFGEAADFSIFITSGSFISKNNRVGGRIAAFEGIDLLNYLVGDDLDSDACAELNKGPWSLVSTGSVNFPSNGQVVGGSIADASKGINVGPTIVNNLSPSCAIDDFANTPVTFNNGFFVSLSENLANIKTGGDIKAGDNKKKNSNVWEFTGSTGSGEGKVDVFDVKDGVDLATTGFWELNNVDSGATIVVNIAGLDVGFRNMDMSPWKKFATRVVFNFYQAKSVTITGVAVHGSILAPKATVIASSAQVRGHIIARTWEANGSVYVPWNGGFEGCLDV